MPFNSFISSLKTGYIYSFDSPKTNGYHHFVLIGHNEDLSEFFFNSFTSKFSKKKSYIEKNGLSEKTLVPIPPSTNNNMTDPENCINCNSPICHTIDELKIIFNNSAKKIPIPIKGRIKDSDIQQILVGTHESDQVEFYIKQFVPKDIDLIKPSLKI